jgi:hypothetical protein
MACVYVSLLLFGMTLGVQTLINLAELVPRGIDWNAAGSLIGGIGSIAAIGVAIWLSKVQYRTTMDVFNHQQQKEDREAKRRQTTQAILAATTLLNLGLNAESTLGYYKTIKLSSRNPDEPQKLDPAADVIQAVSLRLQNDGVSITASIDQFTIRSAEAIVPALTMALDFGKTLPSFAAMLRSGQLTVAVANKIILTQIEQLEQISASAKAAHAIVCEEYELSTIKTRKD